MYARNENQQAERSRRIICDALLALMERHPFADITITMICREAQVVRQTYYRNFEFKEDILDYHLDWLFQAYFQAHFQGRAEDAHTQLLSFYGFMLQNGGFLRLMARNALFYRIERMIPLNVTRFIGIRQIATVEDERAEPFVVGFVAATVCALLARWVEDDFAESPEWMARLTGRLLYGLHGPEGGLPA